MTFISPNNPAKEWIFRELAKRADQGAFSVCDLACGNGSVWYAFLKRYPNVTCLGLDTDKKAIADAQKKFADLRSATFRVVDVQTMKADTAAYDVVTTLSSLEHVVRIDKFLDSVFALLKPGGIAYLNYDDGHFHSHNVKERLMVPVSQLLAKIGIEGPYMKEVDDKEVIRLITERGGKILQIRKHNVPNLKKFTKGYAKGLMGEDVLEAWFAFENRLNELLPSEKLSSLLGATIIVMQKP